MTNLAHFSLSTFVRTTVGATSTAVVAGAAVVTGAAAVQAYGTADAHVDTNVAAMAAPTLVGSIIDATQIPQVFEVPGAGTVELIAQEGALVVASITAVPGMTATVEQHAHGTLSVVFDGVQPLVATFTNEAGEILATMSGALPTSLAGGAAGSVGASASGGSNSANGTTSATSASGSVGTTAEVTADSDSEILIGLP